MLIHCGETGVLTYDGHFPLVQASETASAEMGRIIQNIRRKRTTAPLGGQMARKAARRSPEQENAAAAGTSLAQMFADLNASGPRHVRPRTASAR